MLYFHESPASQTVGWEKVDSTNHGGYSREASTRIAESPAKRDLWRRADLANRSEVRKQWVDREATCGGGVRRRKPKSHGQTRGSRSGGQLRSQRYPQTSIAPRDLPSALSLGCHVECRFSFREQADSVAKMDSRSHKFSNTPLLNESYLGM